MIVEYRRELILGEIELCGIVWNVGTCGWWKRGVAQSVAGPAGAVAGPSSGFGSLNYGDVRNAPLLRGQKKNESRSNARR